MTMTGNPRQVEMDLDDIAGRPRLLRHDCRVAPRERIQQSRLADVGRSGDDDAEAVTQTLASPVGKMMRDGGEQVGDDGVGLHRSVGGDIGLVGEVEPGLGERLRLDELARAKLLERPRPAFSLREAPGAPAPRSRRRRDRRGPRPR